jgi:hypothetical protein
MDQRCLRRDSAWPRDGRRLAELAVFDQLAHSELQSTHHPRRAASIDPHAPMRIIAARRQVLASLLELKERLNEWIGYFNKAGVDCTSINSARKLVRLALDRADSWRTIRNLTFHYGDIVEPPDRLLVTYDAISQISDAEINSVWQAMIEVGQAARNVTLNRA